MFPYRSDYITRLRIAHLFPSTWMYAFRLVVARSLSGFAQDCPRLHVRSFPELRWFYMRNYITVYLRIKLNRLPMSRHFLNAAPSATMFMASSALFAVAA